MHAWSIDLRRPFRKIASLCAASKSTMQRDSGCLTTVTSREIRPTFFGYCNKKKQTIEVGFT